ncbi:DUF732 domain-containing protein [Corynebacterium hindlerae]|uniref:DUF732 domain-containing protein n=1 Tax=Corynebacterium hindlerae TaxID=699041 RepID=UPI0031B6E1ED
MRNTATVVALAAVALTLGACGGGATVDNEKATPSTVAPLAKVPGVEGTPASTSPAKPPRSGGEAAAPAPRDEAVQEVSALPTPAPRPEKEQKLLDDLKKQGIKVEGVEDQMVSVADGICTQDKDNPTVGAVSGQLIEQQRTDKKPEEVADILVKSAKGAYC